MDFSYFCNSTNWSNKPYEEILNDARDIAQYIDQNHWNTIWFSEHHLQSTQRGPMEAIPNPILLSADIAARTSNIRIGQAASICTFWNPIRLAEDLAFLDNLSGGRVEAGLGRGIYGKEAIHMNIEADLKDQPKNKRLFEETLSILKKAWTEDYFSHYGEFYQYPAPNFKYSHPLVDEPSDIIDPETSILKKISLIPKPLQKKLPLWQVVDSPSSIESAAKNGLGCLMWLPTVKSLKERFKIYRQARSELEGRDVPMGEGICLVRDVFIADSMEEAKELAGEHILDYMRWVCGGGRGVSIFADPGEEFPKTEGLLDLLDYQFLHPRNLLVGTADYVIEKIHELKSELNLQHLAVWSSPPGMPHELSMKSIKLFNDKVMPHFSDDRTEVKKVS